MRRTTYKQDDMNKFQKHYALCKKPDIKECTVKKKKKNALCVPIHICLLNRQNEYTVISTRSAVVEMEDGEAPIKGQWDTF